jgi:hypothetical protein
VDRHEPKFNPDDEIQLKIPTPNLIEICEMAREMKLTDLNLPICCHSMHRVQEHIQMFRLIYYYCILF